VLIFPLQFGRYSCHLKVLNAFARGLPVVMTSWANSGAEAVPGEEALVADTPEAFAECIIRLLRDPALAARIAEGGLRRIRREYPSPSVVLDSLEQAYQTVITQKEYRR
jgi:glycosyltransferase involved in cell wall biosynthesis